MKENLALSQRVGAVLKQHGWLISTAESCTGGGVAQCITETPGSSEWFEAGFVTYSNEAKMKNLGVDSALLAQFGAVSEEVARAMAEGARVRGGAHFGVSTTGIAGPGGAVPGKPVGTVAFGWSSARRTHSERVVFDGDRQSVRAQTVIYALEGLLRFIDSETSTN